ncbi:MAG: hypothetical protein IJT48_07210, partial [Bacteroidaceae bacterium]|nr:hypothetical protein [Bacteroidaceae bacterium]
IHHFAPYYATQGAISCPLHPSKARKCLRKRKKNHVCSGKTIVRWNSKQQNKSASLLVANFRIYTFFPQTAKKVETNSPFCPILCDSGGYFLPASPLQSKKMSSKKKKNHIYFALCTLIIIFAPIQPKKKTIMD